jgi:hypothetical protein
MSYCELYVLLYSICRTTIQSAVLPFNLSNYQLICRTTMQYVVLPNTVLYIQSVVLFHSNRFLFFECLIFVFRFTAEKKKLSSSQEWCNKSTSILKIAYNWKNWILYLLE